MPLHFAAFHPHSELADLAHQKHSVIERVDAAHGALLDAAHDQTHVLRVWANARKVLALSDAAEEAVDERHLTLAVLLHDCVPIEKNDPRRSQASRLSAERASAIAAELGFDAAACANLFHAVEAHSFSARITPTTRLAKVLQDADRLDALGAVGIGRLFSVAGRLGQPFYDAADPLAEARPLDEIGYTLDHYRHKLATLADGFQTQAGRALAQARAERAQHFMAAVVNEIQGR